MNTNKEKTENRAQALKNAMKEINSSLGKNSISVGLDFEVELLSTGILAFDGALGGGFIRGRATELQGEEHSFKTAAALVFIANCQKQDLVCAFFDVENRLNPAWARLLGVNWDALAFSQKSMVENVFFAMEKLVDAKAVDVIVVDSIGAFITKKQLSETIEKAADMFAPVARVLSLCLKRISHKANQNGVTIVYINQLREDLTSLYKKYKTPGGRTLKHMLSTQVKINKAAKDDLHKDADKRIVGHDVNIQVVKNSAGGNYGTASFRYFYKTGVDKDYDLFAYCIQKSVIMRRGPIYSFENNSWKGGEAAIKAIQADEELRNKLLSAAQIKMTSEEEERNEAINKIKADDTADIQIEEEEEDAGFEEAVGDLGLEEDDPVAKAVEEDKE